MKVNFETIYEHIGQLMYSIASSSEKFSVAKVEKMKGLVDALWKPESKDDLVATHMLVSLQEGISYSINNVLTPEESFSNFEDYFRIHTLPFNKAIRERIISTARAVFESFPSPEGAIRLDHIMQLLTEHDLRENK